MLYFEISVGQDMNTQGDMAATEVEMGLIPCYAASCYLFHLLTL